MELKDFIKEMDEQSPQWHFEFATKEDLIGAFDKGPNTRQTEVNVDWLRKIVANRLFVCARATHTFLFWRGGYENK